MTFVEIAAYGAAALLGIAVAFQLLLAAGAPLGEATMGGRATTVGGVLTPGYRIAAGASAIVLVLSGWLVLARAGIVSVGSLGEWLLTWGPVAVAAFLVLNTISNVSGHHPLERWGMGLITFVSAILVIYILVAAPPI